MSKLNIISRTKNVFPDMESGTVSLLLWSITVLSVHTEIISNMPGNHIAQSQLLD